MKAADIKNICAVGAGAMGSTTALCFAMAGYKVWLYDLTEVSLASGLKNIHATLKAFQKHNLIQESEILGILGRVKTTALLEEAAQGADFVIESVFENLEVKQKIFATLDKLCPPHTLFATNTSGLSPTKIAEPVTRKDKFVVTHFWNPAHLIPLVEVVPGEHTSEDTLDIACELMLSLGKKPVRLKRELPGFIGNRLQLALLREAFHLLSLGVASAEDIDVVVKYSLGRRLSETGPFESADLGGLDVFKNIFSYLGKDLGNETSIPEPLVKAVEAGNLGAKTGEGLYKWPTDKLSDLKQRRENRLFEHLKEDRDQESSDQTSSLGHTQRQDRSIGKK